MTIPFRRIGTTPQEFAVQIGGVTFSGTLTLKSRTLILLKAQLTGELELPCDICAEPMTEMLDEEVEFLLSDGVYSGSEEELDVVEVEDSTIDIDALAVSEIELIKSDYHSCANCTN